MKYQHTHMHIYTYVDMYIYTILNNYNNTSTDGHPGNAVASDEQIIFFLIIFFLF